MMRCVLLCGVVAIICLASMRVLAVDLPKEDSYRLCQAKDLAGTFVLVRLIEQPIGPEETLHRQRPHQYLAFFDNTHFSRADSTREIKTSKDVYHILSWPQKQHVDLHYTLDEKEGSLMLYEGDILTYRYRCMYIKQKVNDLIEGDLVLTSYTKAKTLVYKVYRHWF